MLDHHARAPLAWIALLTVVGMLAGCGEAPTDTATVLEDHAGVFRTTVPLSSSTDAVEGGQIPAETLTGSAANACVSANFNPPASNFTGAPANFALLANTGGSARSIVSVDLFMRALSTPHDVAVSIWSRSASGNRAPATRLGGGTVRVGLANAIYTTNVSPTVDLAAGTDFFIVLDNSSGGGLVLPISNTGTPVTHYFAGPPNWNGPFPNEPWNYRVNCSAPAPPPPPPPPPPTPTFDIEVFQIDADAASVTFRAEWTASQAPYAWDARPLQRANGKNQHGVVQRNSVNFTMQRQSSRYAANFRVWEKLPVGYNSLGSMGFTVPAAPPPTLSAPTLRTPIGGSVVAQNNPATGAPLHPTRGYGLIVDFDWDDVPGAAQYEVFAAFRGGLPNQATLPIVNTSVSTSSLTLNSPNAFVTDQNLTPWRWRVRAVDSQGQPGPWSAWEDYRYEPCRLASGQPCHT